MRVFEDLGPYREKLEFGFFSFIFWDMGFHASETRASFYFKEHVLFEEVFPFKPVPAVLVHYAFLAERLSMVAFSDLPLHLNDESYVFRALVMSRLALGD